MKLLSIPARARSSVVDLDFGRCAGGGGRAIGRVLIPSDEGLDGG